MAKNKDFPQKVETDPLALFIRKSHSWMGEYFKPLVFSLVFGFLCLGSFFLYSYWETRQNQQAEEELYQAKKALVALEKKAGGDMLSFDRAQNFFTQPKKATHNSEIAEAVLKYAELVKSRVSLSAGRQAVLELAPFLNQYTEHRALALDLMKKAHSYKSKTPTGFLIAFQLGSYLMDQKEYSSAREVLQFIAENEKAKWLWPEALMKTALCYEKETLFPQAEAIYKKVKEDFADSPVGVQAGHNINWLKLQKKR